MRRTSIIFIFLATICGIHGLAQAPATAGPERGTLVLEGGGTTIGVAGSKPTAVIQKFVQLAGGSAARIVVIPTAFRDDLVTPDGLQQVRVRAQEIMGVDHVTMMHTRDRKQADSPEFVAPLRQATGVWIPGGKDAYLIDAYVGTRVEIEIKALLARGGVVGGTSAGAVIQGSLAVEGKVVDSEGKVVDSPVNQGGKTLRVDATLPSWGLLTNSFVEPHWNTRNRVDLAPALAGRQGLLGIAIDEDTAAIVQGNRLEVLGDGHVAIFDGKVHGGKPYYDLSPGDRFDLHTRSSMPVN
ncbi:MAG TPA: cyanophycinase [Candidatus Angelobacter sp.]|nr:cyanophycinase [Candidatus Angelobacter sp.]